ncbi:hypothetical protein [Sphingorhabdus contaminans]|uniref:Uncharacterized protein n=1 Tax=Sphingorhabdus contaminans TaxID=1343899 RepID=A0A553WH12_9SPHN|nr:hypothetical protein [Sphingorhabdus contaminans]TSB03983.1 hypothetical protein FOM92_00615 [Sphingorhabdus contaminans]
MVDDRLPAGTWEEKIERIRQVSEVKYGHTTIAANSSANWLLGAATTANSAGFYFAMSAPNAWLTISAALAFVLALTLTFACGYFVTRVHALDAESADFMRQADLETFKEQSKGSSEATDDSLNSSAWLQRTAIASLTLMCLGGLLLVASKGSALIAM